MKKIMFFLACISCSAFSFSGTPASIEKDVLNHYSDIALAMYSDSLSSAQALQSSLAALTEKPNKQTLATARTAWVAARVPYQQTEVYRFGNAIVDDWEGRVNAWPLDEGLIDYVAASYGGESDDNPLYTANVIANTSLVLSGNKIDTSNITKDLLQNTLHEIDSVEANVATGYHAIEFLLWGQDLNGTGPGAGNRPASDFNTNNCSWGNCDRRAQYLLTAGELLIDDLAWMVNQWKTNGEARQSLLQDEDAGIRSMLVGMGSLSYGELAGERIKLGVLLHDPEEEHDCFSDNTHHSHYYDILGIQNVYLGQYKTLSGKTITGPSLSSLVATNNPAADLALKQTISRSLDAAQIVVDSAEIDNVAYDQLLAQGNTEGNAKVMGIVTALLDQTKAIEGAVTALNISLVEFEGSDSLDSPQAVFQ
ncbi:MAG: putative iron-regulated protein [Candidatus Endobugula sp.]|jgi:putative iron-regulated protein